jgi:hypothetical protein
LEKFRRVSKLKQALERRPPIRRLSLAVKAPVAKAAPVAIRQTVFDLEALRSSVTPQQISTEETRLRQVEESIRVFVRVADPKFRQVVPMRFFNLTLAPAEASACSADYLEEKTLRGSIARALLRIVAVVARISTEQEELSRADNSPSLWKLHADSLAALLEVAGTLSDQAEEVAEQARKQGHLAEEETIRASLQRLRHRSDATVAALSETGSRAARV